MTLGNGTPLPWSSEAEISVLGGILAFGSEAFHEAASVTTADDFYRESHRRIYRALAGLHERGTGVDVVTVTDALRNSGELDGVGGLDYLADLIDAVPTAANIAYHAGLVAETAARRRLIVAASETIRAASSGEQQAAEVLADSHARLLTVLRASGTGYVPIGSGLVEAIAEMEAPTGHGIRTGLPHLDRLTDGLQPADLIVLAARPSMGKTALALQIALHAGDRNQNVLVASLEMARAQLTKRAIGSLAGLPTNRAVNRSPDDWARIAAAAGRLHTLPIRIDDVPGDSMAAVRAGIHRAASQFPPRLVVLDYLQLLEAKGENRNQQVSTITRGLKALAKELACPVLALSQLSREVEKRSPPRPQLSDLRDSGSIEQDADLVLLLWRPEYYFTDKTTAETRAKLQGKAELVLAKQRNGPTGSVPLHWDAPSTRFTEEVR